MGVPCGGNRRFPEVRGHGTGTVRALSPWVRSQKSARTTVTMNIIMACANAQANGTTEWKLSTRFRFLQILRQAITCWVGDGTVRNRHKSGRRALMSPLWLLLRKAPCSFKQSCAVVSMVYSV